MLVANVGSYTQGLIVSPKARSIPMYIGTCTPLTTAAALDG